MQKYIISRLIRSIFSIIAVVGIVFVLVYSLVPRDNIIVNDPTYVKAGNADQKTEYKYTKFEQLGYLEFVSYAEYLAENSLSDTAENIEGFKSYYTELGYTIENLRFTYSADTIYNAETGQDDPILIPLAYKDVSPLALMVDFFANMIHIDNPYVITDASNDTLDSTRGIYIGNDWSGNVALMCNGCENKYLIYFTNVFPFVHQNIITFDLGTAYPTYAGNDIVTLITGNQGAAIKTTVTYPTGLTTISSVNEYSCTYTNSSSITDFQRRYFLDNYANCSINTDGASMMANSFTIGIIAVILSYLIGFPVGLLMAKNKNKTADKLGMIYIIFIIAVPSLAYILLFKRIGASLGLPVLFPDNGIAGYILPVVSLALPSVAGIMMWIRRYMIDQSSSDYVKFARSKGLSENEIFSKHIMRNAIIPIVHGIPGSIVGALTGAFITEKVYSVGGMGKMLTGALTQFNNPIIIALTLFYTALSVFSLFAGDILMAVVDPRISFSEGGRK